MLDAQNVPEITERSFTKAGGPASGELLFFFRNNGTLRKWISTSLTQ
jgi:hypothetical protein